jgi:hypothetical protein
LPNAAEAAREYFLLLMPASNKEQTNQLSTVEEVNPKGKCDGFSWI